MALARPVDSTTTVRTFSLLVAFVTTLALAGVMLTTRVRRWTGGLFRGFSLLCGLSGWCM